MINFKNKKVKIWISIICIIGFSLFLLGLLSYIQVILNACSGTEIQQTACGGVLIGIMWTILVALVGFWVVYSIKLLNSYL